MTKNFLAAEFACKCGCGRNMISRLLVDQLQKLRDEIGRPITVISGYRCRLHNTLVGGGQLSQHVLGNAADIRVKGMTPRQLYEVARKYPAFTGIGVNDRGNTLHLDVRPVKAAKWCYDDQGKPAPWFDA